MSRRRRGFALVALIGVVVSAVIGSVTACAGDASPPATTVPPRIGGLGLRSSTTDSTIEPPSATAAPSGTAQVSALDLPSSITCATGQSIPVTATYQTAGATRVAFLIDNHQVEGSPPLSGTFAVPVPCDGQIHTVVIAAIDATGANVLQSRAVATKPDGRQRT